ncbi:MAG TPA: multidrug ABC transporter permease [Planctomycetaceae bacterium]|nr:multidrug ABC transporter permease [Planctomycetaceae bacterium]
MNNVAVSASSSLARRELIRFFRQPNRVIGAIGTPLVMWLLFGLGLEESFSVSPSGETQDENFLQYYFPGTLVLVLMFTAIFATISVIEDRSEGFLQGVLVSPVPRWSIVLGKVIGGTVIAVLQAVLMLLIAIALPMQWNLVAVLHLFGIFVAGAFGLTCLGFVLAWKLDNVHGFHAIMNLLLMPMWLLSGAFFPIPELTAQSSVGQMMIHWLMKFDPLTYVVSLVRQVMYESQQAEKFWQPDLDTSWFITLSFCAVMFLIACRVVRQPT